MSSAANRDLDVSSVSSAAIKHQSQRPAVFLLCFLWPPCMTHALCLEGFVSNRLCFDESLSMTGSVQPCYVVQTSHCCTPHAWGFSPDVYGPHFWQLHPPPLTSLQPLENFCGFNRTIHTYKSVTCLLFANTFSVAWLWWEFFTE